MLKINKTLKYVLGTTICIVFLGLGFLVGVGTSYEEPNVPDCIVKDCPICLKQQECNQTERIVYVNQTIDSCNIGNDTTFLKLLQRTQRCEINLDAYYKQNTTTLCQDTIDNLHNCELRLNKTKEALE